MCTCYKNGSKSQLSFLEVFVQFSQLSELYELVVDMKVPDNLGLKPFSHSGHI